jgi:hypothetical protein
MSWSDRDNDDIYAVTTDGQTIVDANKLFEQADVIGTIDSLREMFGGGDPISDEL